MTGVYRRIMKSGRRDSRKTQIQMTLVASSGVRYYPCKSQEIRYSVLYLRYQPSLVGYSRLVMFSFGFQQAYQRGFEAGDSLFLTSVSFLAEIH